jgi:hypothetical protein
MNLPFSAEPILVNNHTEAHEAIGAHRGINPSVSFYGRDGFITLGKVHILYSARQSDIDVFAPIKVNPRLEGIQWFRQNLAANLSHDRVRATGIDIANFDGDRLIIGPAGGGLESQNPNLWPVSRYELLSGQAYLPTNHANQKIGEKANGDGGQRSDGTIVSLKKIDNAPKGYDRSVDDRSPIVPIAFASVLIAIPILGWLAARER